jgi:hypothetical protein
MSNDEPILGNEYPPENEAQFIAALTSGLLASMQAQPTPKLRGQHAKSHGCVSCEVRVLPSLPAELKVGAFREPKTYQAWLRFSNGRGRGKDGNVISDMFPDVRGAALKLLADESTSSPAQDFVFVNSSRFFVRNVRDYLDFFPVAKAKEEGRLILEPGKPPVVPEDLKANFEASGYAFKILGPVVMATVHSPLEIQYWSATPFLFGSTAAKFSLKPHSTNGKFNRDSAKDADNYLNEAATEHLRACAATFDLQVQFQTDAVAMLVEDPTVDWDTAQSPYVTVATVHVPSQEFNSEQRLDLGERMSFSPWNCYLLSVNY